MAKTTKSNSVPNEMKPRFDEISNIIGELCNEKLNEEYKQLSIQLCAALCRKRPSPLNSGRSNTWACGIVHAIGTVNFLFDPAQNPHMKASELSDWFGISQSTGGTKSKQIRDLMKIKQWDVEWTLPSGIDSNPLAWMIELDGFMVDVRNCSPMIQEEAFRRGYIPYLPGTKK